MTRSRSLFARSPFARRMVLLFFGCALLPVATVAVLSYRSVERNLLEQARLGLQQESKMVGMGVVERLLSLEASLQFAALQIRSAPAGTLDTELRRVVARNLSTRFEAVAIEAPEGSWRPLSGTLDAGPALDLRERAHLAGGRTLVRTSRTGSISVDVVLVLEIDPSRPGAGRLWARADPEYLWGLGARNTLPPRSELAVVDDAGGLVIRSEAVPQGFPRLFREATEGRSDRWLEWQHDGRRYVAGSWKIPMQTNYLAGAWTVVLSESRDSLMGPVATFRRTFPLVILATLWIVLLLSLSQIRRLLGPLEQLRRGTQRLARGEFGQQVEVASRDELAELAGAFNSMAEQLSAQFDTLATLETAARTALATGDRAAVIRDVLPRVRRLLGCQRLSLLVLDPGDPEALRFSTGPEGDGAGSFSEGRVPLATLPVLEDLRMGRPCRVGDAVAPGGRGVAGILYPLMAGGELIAVLAIEGENAAEAALRVEGELAEQLAVILQQSRLRAALEAERRRLETLLEYLPSGIMLLDHELRITLANRIARDCLRVLSGAAVGGRLESLGGTTVADLVAFKEPIPHELVTGGPEPRVFQVVAGRLQSEDALPSTVIVLREVTREREIEVQMQRQERLAAVGQLAAGISHDFNNLLQGITMAAELLRLTPDLPAPLHDTTREIGREAQRGARLIRQILDFSRRTASSRTAVDVGQVVEETLELLRRTLPESITVHFGRPDEEMVVLADAVHLQQIVMNLAVNARDAMPEGGRLDLRLTGLEVREFDTRPVPEMRPGDWVRIEVADTGHGIPPEIGGKVFEPFFTTKAEGLGTGLGLAQVYGLVRQHGGHIEFTSRTGSGTVFHVYLPRERELAGPEVARWSEETERGRGEHVLVVDNRRSLLETTCRTLEELGFRTTGVASAAEALEVFQDANPGLDLVLSDVVMPGMSGIELLRRLRQQRPTVPVVLMSGYVSDDHLARLEALGGAQVLHKPFDAATLARALRRALDACPEVGVSR